MVFGMLMQKNVGLQSNSIRAMVDALGAIAVMGAVGLIIANGL